MHAIRWGGMECFLWICASPCYVCPCGPWGLVCLCMIMHLFPWTIHPSAARRLGDSDPSFSSICSRMPCRSAACIWIGLAPRRIPAHTGPRSGSPVKNKSKAHPGYYIIFLPAYVCTSRLTHDDEICDLRSLVWARELTFTGIPGVVAVENAWGKQKRCNKKRSPQRLRNRLALYCPENKWSRSEYESGPVGLPCTCSCGVGSTLNLWKQSVILAIWTSPRHFKSCLEIIPVIPGSFSRF